MLRIPHTSLDLEQDDVEYAYGPDSDPRPGVEPGTATTFTIDDPADFPGTRREVMLHVPANLPSDEPVATTVFLDGTWYLDPQGAFRAGIVLDNLVAVGAVPPMVGVFVDPGVFPDITDPHLRKNRNTEYDDPGSRLADFLVNTVLPMVSSHVCREPDPTRTAICGGSSGGNAAFTAAWHRPDVFGRVIALGASFAQMPGGNPYPHLIPATLPKPLRVFLTAAHHDLGWNEPDRNWFAENLLVAAALAKTGYDMRLVLREGGHSMVNGGAILPDALRWVWANREDWEPGARDSRDPRAPT